MDWKQREAAARHRRIATARQWAAEQDLANDGFADWYEDTGQEDDYAAAHAVWLTSPARIERWAERNGIFVGRAFAKWYLAEGRTDSFVEAYEVYRSLRHTEVETSRARRADA